MKRKLSARVASGQLCSFAVSNGVKRQCESATTAIGRLWVRARNLALSCCAIFRLVLVAQADNQKNIEKNIRTSKLFMKERLKFLWMYYLAKN